VKKWGNLARVGRGVFYHSISFSLDASGLHGHYVLSISTCASSRFNEEISIKTTAHRACAARTTTTRRAASHRRDQAVAPNAARLHMKAWQALALSLLPGKKKQSNDTPRLTRVVSGGVWTEHPGRVLRAVLSSLFGADAIAAAHPAVW